MDGEFLKIGGHTMDEKKREPGGISGGGKQNNSKVIFSKVCFDSVSSLPRCLG